MCSWAVTPIDWTLNNAAIRSAMEWAASEVCIWDKIEGGEKSVCTGAV